MISRRLGVSRQAVYQFLKKNEDMRAVLESAREELLDAAETTLYQKAIGARETASLIFLLKCKGKARGWVEGVSADITSGGKPLDLGLREIVADALGGEVDSFVPIDSLEDEFAQELQGEFEEEGLDGYGRKLGPGAKEDRLLDDDILAGLGEDFL